MRSPFAAAFLAKKLAGIATVRSAGFHPAVGRAPPTAIIELARNAGIDLTMHRSSILSVADLDRTDLIVLMDRSNWRALVQLGANERKMMWLGAMDRHAELADPYGRPAAEMMGIMLRLQACCEALAQTIVQRFEQSASPQKRI
jgi:protein-tyrosine-phosphatase